MLKLGARAQQPLQLWSPLLWFSVLWILLTWLPNLLIGASLCLRRTTLGATGFFLSLCAFLQGYLMLVLLTGGALFGAYLWG